jgi:hypothetical protein
MEEGAPLAAPGSHPTLPEESRRGNRCNLASRWGFPGAASGAPSEHRRPFGSLRITAEHLFYQYQISIYRFSIGIESRLGSDHETNQDPNDRICHLWDYQPSRFCVLSRREALSSSGNNLRLLWDSGFPSGSLLLVFRATLSFPLHVTDFPLASLLFYGEESLD